MDNELEQYMSFPDQSLLKVRVPSLLPLFIFCQLDADEDMTQRMAGLYNKRSLDPWTTTLRKADLP